MLTECFSTIPRSNLSVPTPDYASLAKQTHFSIKELKFIFARFERCCDENNGMLSEVDFLRLPELAFSPLVRLIYDYEAERRRNRQDNSVRETLVTSTSVEFDTFVFFLNIFSCKSTDNEKILYLFNILKTGESNTINEDQFKRFIGTIYQGSAPSGFVEGYIDVAWKKASRNATSIDSSRFSELLSSLICIH
jgi:Ca2+-binding EF-hand superfamily protein